MPKSRSLLAGAGTLVLAVVLLSGCGSSSSSRAGLTKITADQKELQALDGRAADFQRGTDSVSDAEAIATDYHALLDKARSQRPDGATGDEAKVWQSFIAVLALRAQAADMLVRAARAGDFSGLDAKIAALNDKTRTLNNNFNHALATFRGEKPPPSQVSPTGAARASAENLRKLKNRLDSIDRLISTPTARPKSFDDLRPIVARYRSATSRYTQLLAEARPQARHAYRLPQANTLGLAPAWRTFLLLVKQRQAGMTYAVSAFQKVIETRTLPPDLQTRLQSLKAEGDRLNARWARVANRLNENLR